MLVDVGLADVRGWWAGRSTSADWRFEPDWLGPCGKSPPHTRLPTDQPGWWTVQLPQCQAGAEARLPGPRPSSGAERKTRPEPERRGHPVARFPPVSEQRPNATRGHRRVPPSTRSIDQLDGAGEARARHWAVRRGRAERAVHGQHERLPAAERTRTGGLILVNLNLGRRERHVGDRLGPLSVRAARRARDRARRWGRRGRDRDVPVLDVASINRRCPRRRDRRRVLTGRLGRAGRVRARGRGIPRRCQNCSVSKFPRPA